MITKLKTICAVIAFCIPLSHTSPIHLSLDEASEFSQPVSKGIDTAEDRLKEYYYQLVANNYFDPLSYNNPLILGNIDFDGDDIRFKGTTLLKLIEELEQRNDKSAKLLLQRLNKFFVFKMHRLLSENDLRQKQSVRMLGCLDDLYGHKIATPAGAVAPFRTLLTKTFIVLAMVNDGNTHYNSRKETMLWHMNKLKHELLEINRQLGEQQIDPLIIKDFILLLAVYETKQPMIQPNQLKDFAFKAIIVTAICLVLYWQRRPLKKYVIKPVVDGCNNVIGAFGDGLKSLAKAAGKGAAEGVMEHVDANKETIKAAIVKTTTEAVGAAIPEAIRKATHDPIPDPVAMPAGQTTVVGALGKQLGATAAAEITAVLHEAVHKPMATAEKLPEGQTTLIASLGKELGTGIGEELTKPFDKNRIPTPGPNETTFGKKIGQDVIDGIGEGAAGAPGGAWQRLRNLFRRGPARAAEAQPPMPPTPEQQQPGRGAAVPPVPGPIPAARGWRAWRPW